MHEGASLAASGGLAIFSLESALGLVWRNQASPGAHSEGAGGRLEGCAGERRPNEV